MSTNMVKKVLVEQAELDRLHQRQLQDYSPELHSLARLQTQMTKVLWRKNLSADQKLDLLLSLQTRFDRLKKDTGALSGGPSKVQTLPSVKPEDPTEESVLEDDDEADGNETEDTEVEHEETLEPRTPPPELDDFQRMNMDAKHRVKARHIYDRIMDSPAVLSRNVLGEMVLNERAVPDSDFNALFQSLFAAEDAPVPPGIGEFLDALYHLEVPAKDITNKTVRDLYAKPIVRGTVQERLAKYKDNKAGKFDKTLDLEIAEYIGQQAADAGKGNAAKLLRRLGLSPPKPEPKAKPKAKPKPPLKAGPSTIKKSPTRESTVKSKEVVFNRSITHPPLEELGTPFAPPSGSTPKSKGQSGKGRPPGRKPNILYVY